MKSLTEQDGELVENWYIAALSHEVLGYKPISRSLYSKHYVLFRDSEGKPRALEDRCLHRGTKLSEGSCDKDGIRCPYHGWAYDPSGALIDIPSDGPKANRDRNWKIPSAPVIEQDGAVWLWTGTHSPDPVTPPWRFPFAENSAWTKYFMITNFENEVTHLVQNFMDVPHTVFVHSKWFRNKAMIQVPYELEMAKGRVKATYHKPADSVGSAMNYFINPKRQPMQHTDEFVFPNITRVDYRFGDYGLVINSQCTPVDRFKSRVYTWIAFRGNWLAPLSKPLMRFYTRRVIEQDVVIMANQGSNLVRFNERGDWKSTAADEIHLAISRIRELGIKSKASALEPSLKKESIFWI
jgi:phenylpropionate dioxygenase-like ring-hydroxylating dioxygenase large terminal subunit